MLNNLRGAYFRAGDFSKAVEALDLLIEAAPQAAAYYKERGVARLQLRRLTAANSDFRAYLKRAPDASDRAEITTQMEAIQRWLAALN
jgi:regulator of sirC expression with transglutaminase-like and TPR domain